MAVRIWRFTITYDDGMAPCSQDGMLSLLSCKRRVREWAKVGDWLVAYRQKHLGGISFVGRVSRKMTIGDYQLEFPDRRDAVYRRIGYNADGSEQLERLRLDYHPEQELWERDMNGRFVLLFDPYWYWGCDGHTPPEFVMDMVHYRGQKAATTPAQLQALTEWLTFPGGHLGEPCSPDVVKRRLCGGC